MKGSEEEKYIFLNPVFSEKVKQNCYGGGYDHQFEICYLFVLKYLFVFELPVKFYLHEANKNEDSMYAIL